MNDKLKSTINNKSFDFIFVLALLSVFAFGALMTVIMGSNVYKGIKEDMDSNFEFRTPLSYIGTKIRQNDAVDSIHLVEKEGVKALVLEQKDGEEICQTWIYEYDGYLYEVYIDKGTSFLLEDGIPIIPSNGLEFDLTDNMLHIKAKDHYGKTRELSLSFRTGQGGVPE